ncbi:N-acetylmuramoyl-L-alanine amidase [Hydrogenimonas cancrithermarum]|uniref:N-acetylmuramoyl-L-alanine amidase n=1 Tax=Hydrogenimonas cancrithermarum TaxID=2993563 RepID=A0ABN6WVI9_9BACT|nr:peptidoglycan recognition family protein [Hydrogenimonas cancrithermarum]BDY12885.1 N-acetylmuramoyl-L-alanine amidase [Hydrogenimonas cancrithermarum]BDY13002.1 N-acetylmuramoyl-L-alanine amidase [Hydrogenimonas cancrithermarum]
MRFPLLWLLCLVSLFALDIVDKPIAFGPERVALTKAYMKTHYGIQMGEIGIIPKIIVIHYTATEDLEGAYRCFVDERLSGGRGDIAGASSLNVSAHFLVDRNGAVYKLMDETTMARHVIGLNHCSIGIENVGGVHGPGDLTPAQLKANIELVRYLMKKYPTIEYLIGHHEYRRFEGHPLWREKDAGYRTRKSDPGNDFMRALRRHFPSLKPAP